MKKYLSIFGRRIIFCRYTVFVALIIMLSTTESFAQVSIEHVKVTGLGITESSAIENALVEAVYQIYGLRISSDVRVSVFSKRSNDGAIYSSQIHQVIHRQSVPNHRNELLGYDVVSSQQDLDGQYVVNLRAKYSKYKIPGIKNERRTLVVLDFPVSSGGYPFEKPAEVSGFLSSQIESLLIQSRRFAVLDRKRGDIYSMEKNILRSSDVNIAERARLGKVLGADYMVYGEILPVQVERIDKSIKISGEYKEQIVATVPVMFKVLAMATRQIKWSSTVVGEDIVENKNVVIRIDQIIESLLGRVAGLIFEELTENIYPPKIVKVLTADRFVLNRGGNTVENGMLFDVFNSGEYIIDPDTGEPIDRIETYVGLARVVEKKPKYSIVVIETGEGPIKEGMILRKYRGDDNAKSKQSVVVEPSYQDDDNDGLPDYLQLLNPDLQN